MKKQKQLAKVTATYIEPQKLRLTCVAVAARQHQHKDSESGICDGVDKATKKTKWVQLDLFDDCEDRERKLPV